MQGGKLHEAVAFDEPTGVADAFGGEAIAWTERHTCRAQWVYGRGDETLQAARNAGRKVYKIKIRQCAAVDAVTEAYRMRDVRRNTAWNIIEVDTITNRRFAYIAVEGPSERDVIPVPSGPAFDSGFDLGFA